MKTLRVLFILMLVLAGVVHAQEVKKDLPYAEPSHPRQVLDIYTPTGAKNLPVVFWIHGGGWQTGDKSSVQEKPKAFMEKGHVFVSTNYRLLPEVDMGTIVRDIAKSLAWVHGHVAQHGGDPDRILVMGHSAGAQLAALICTDERYLRAEGLSLGAIKACVPVDGDTYDVPHIIEAAAARRKALGQPEPKFGHYQKFGNDPKLHREYSAVNHVAAGKDIPPFFLLHVAADPNTTSQARRLGAVLKKAGIETIVFGAENTDHTQINADLGKASDVPTQALFAFLNRSLSQATPTANLTPAAPEKTRAFFTGHSFHVFVPGALVTLSRQAGIEGYESLGVQSLGGSRVIQHWNLPDEKNAARAALAKGDVDVLTLSPNMQIPDEGIEPYVDFAVKHNPKIRILVQGSWMTWDGAERKGFTNASRDLQPVAGVRGRTRKHLDDLRAQLKAINARHGREVCLLVPAGTAVVRLRELVAEKKLPGIDQPSQLFTDDIGHATPAIRNLVAYLFFGAIHHRDPRTLPGLDWPAKGSPPSPGLEKVLQQVAWETLLAEPLSGVSES